MYRPSRDDRAGAARGRLPSIRAAALLAVGLSCACGGGPPEPTLAPVPERSRLFYSNTGPVRDSIRLVLREEGEFADFWGRATAQEEPGSTRPTVDFERSMVVVVAAGRMTPEDEIHVDSVGVEPERTVEGDVEDVLKVVVRTTRGCGQFRTEAFPLEIVQVRRFEGNVRFVERRGQRTDCR